MSSAVYNVEFTCDKCRKTEAIPMPQNCTLDAEMLRYYAPNDWVVVRVVKSGWGFAGVFHYCPGCNFEARKALGLLTIGEENQS